ncbi:MAG: glycosyltransferase [Phycisphaera sp. TMED9]|nr:MAG: glycosyltransferase [Phycisphaera sp. TMED9]
MIRVDSYHAWLMSLAISITTLVFAVLAAATAIYWGFVFGRLVRLARHTPELRDGLQMNVVDELVSIIVPAHDEARVIERMVTSMRAQQDMNIELIVVLDRCTDDTFGRLTEAAGGDPRIRVVVNDTCPEGWAGKCNAAAVGAAEATGEWVLFTDADVQFDPGVVRAAVAIAAENDVDLLSAYTRLTSGHWWEIIVQPPAAITLLRMFPPDRVNSEDRPRSFANGQFLLFRRAAYDRLGGHSTVKDDLLEDLAFAKAVHRQGGRVRVVHSDTMIQTSMYESLDDLLSGWRRIFIESCHRNVGRLNRNVIRVAGAGLGPVASFFGVVVGLVSFDRGEFWIGLVGIIAGGCGVVISGVTLAVIFGRGGMPRVGILGWPLGCLLVAGALRRGATDLEKGRPIRWGGREYVIEPGR